MSGKRKHAARSRRSYHANMAAARSALAYFEIKNRIKATKRSGGFLSNLFRRKAPASKKKACAAE